MRLVTGIVMISVMQFIGCNKSIAQPYAPKETAEGKKRRVEYEEFERLSPFPPIYSDEFHIAIMPCESAKEKARESIRQGRCRYLILSQFGLDRTSMIQACILKDKFNVAPYRAFIGCFPDMSKVEVETYGCFNEVIDSFLSVKYNIYFPKVLKEQADKEAKLPKRKLVKKYPFLKFEGY